MARSKFFIGITDQRRAALKRREDARVLFEQGEQHFMGAMYLGGYTVECNLKWLLMEINRVNTLKELAEKLQVDDSILYTHKLEALINILPGDYSWRFRISDVWRDFRTEISHWSPEWRYSPKIQSKENAENFLNAVDNISTWLKNNR